MPSSPSSPCHHRHGAPTPQERKKTRRSLNEVEGREEGRRHLLSGPGPTKKNKLKPYKKTKALPYLDPGHGLACTVPRTKNSEASSTATAGRREGPAGSSKPMPGPSVVPSPTPGGPTRPPAAAPAAPRRWGGLQAAGAPPGRWEERCWGRPPARAPCACMWGCCDAGVHGCGRAGGPNDGVGPRPAGLPAPAAGRA
jgi:hypothetical protein